MTSLRLANLFHVCAAATGNARSPTVDRRVDGTSNAEVDNDRRCCRPEILGTAEGSRPIQRLVQVHGSTGIP